MHGNYYFLSGLDWEDLRALARDIVDELVEVVELDSNNWLTPIVVVTRDGFVGWFEEVEGELRLREPKESDEKVDFQQLWRAAAHATVIRSGLFDVSPVSLGLPDEAQTRRQREIEGWSVAMCRQKLMDAVFRALQQIGENADLHQERFEKGSGELADRLWQLRSLLMVLQSPTFPFAQWELEPYSLAAFASWRGARPEDGKSILVVDIHT